MAERKSPLDGAEENGRITWSRSFRRAWLKGFRSITAKPR